MSAPLLDQTSGPIIKVTEQNPQNIRRLERSDGLIRRDTRSDAIVRLDHLLEKNGMLHADVYRLMLAPPSGGKLYIQGLVSFRVDETQGPGP